MKKQPSIASQLKHRITIESLTETPDGSGGFTSSWGTFVALWASVKPLSGIFYGKEIYASGQVEARQQVRFTIRYRTDITPAMRINFGGALYNLRAVTDPDGSMTTLVLVGEEGVAL